MMEHQQHIMQHQHRSPIQSHDIMQQQQQSRSARRPRSRGRGHQSDESAIINNGVGVENHGHIMQSRTSSNAHVLTKRQRSRSRGKRRTPRSSNNNDHHHHHHHQQQQHRPRTPPESNLYDSNEGLLQRTLSLGNISSAGSTHYNNNNSMVYQLISIQIHCLLI